MAALCADRGVERLVCVCVCWGRAEAKRDYVGDGLRFCSCARPGIEEEKGAHQFLPHVRDDKQGPRDRVGGYEKVSASVGYHDEQVEEAEQEEEEEHCGHAVDRVHAGCGRGRTLAQSTRLRVGRQPIEGVAWTRCGQRIGGRRGAERHETTKPAPAAAR